MIRSGDALKTNMLSLLLAVWLWPAWAATQVTHGPLVGGVTHTSARILARTENAAPMFFELATDSLFTTPQLTETATPQAEDDYFIVFDISGLEADTRYYYRPVVNGIPVQLVGSFRTFPPPGQASTFSFAFGACQQAARDPNSFQGRVFPLIVEEAPRFFLQLGDWTYPDTTDTPANPTDFFNADFARVQANYRSKYDPDYPMAQLFRVAPLDYVYDDHDYANNNTDMTAPAKANSVRGYRAMFPHYPLPNPDGGLWHSFTFGDAEFFVLDTRTQRHPNDLAFHQDDWQGDNHVGREVASGVYVYRLDVRAPDGRRLFVGSRKMLLLR